MAPPSQNILKPRWLPALGWMSVIFAFSQHANIESGLSYDFVLKKTCHLAEYGFLAVLFYFALTHPLGLWARRHAEKAWAWSVLFAVSDEFHQSFIPTRSAQPRDVVIDSVGAALGLWLCFRLSRLPGETVDPRPEPPPLPPPVEFMDPSEAPTQEIPRVSKAPKRKTTPVPRRSGPAQPRERIPKPKRAASHPDSPIRPSSPLRRTRRKKRNPQMRLELRPSHIRRLRK